MLQFVKWIFPRTNEDFSFRVYKYMIKGRGWEKRRISHSDKACNFSKPRGGGGYCSLLMTLCQESKPPFYVTHFKGSLRQIVLLVHMHISNTHPLNHSITHAPLDLESWTKDEANRGTRTIGFVVASFNIFLFFTHLLSLVPLHEHSSIMQEWCKLNIGGQEINKDFFSNVTGWHTFSMP